MVVGLDSTVFKDWERFKEKAVGSSLLKRRWFLGKEGGLKGRVLEMREIEIGKWSLILIEESTEMECTEFRIEEEAIAKSRTLPCWCVAVSGRMGERSNSEIREEKEEVSVVWGEFILTLKSPARMTVKITHFVKWPTNWPFYQKGKVSVYSLYGL